MNTKYLLPTLFAALGLFLVTPTLDALVLFELDTEFSGASEPSGPAPWATVSIVDDGAGGVNITFNTDGLSASEFITEWDLNFTGDATLLNSLAFTTSDSPTATVTTSLNGIQADGDTGKYDIEFAFPSSPPRLSENLSVTYNVSSLLGNITEEMFNTTNDPSSKGGPYFTAAHVQGIGPDGEGSGWIGTPVPEPSTYLMLGSFIAAAAFLKRRKKVKAN